MLLLLFPEFLHLLGRESGCRVTTAVIWYIIPGPQTDERMEAFTGRGCQEKPQKNRTSESNFSISFESI